MLNLLAYVVIIWLILNTIAIIHEYFEVKLLVKIITILGWLFIAGIAPYVALRIVCCLVYCINQLLRLI